MAKTIKVDLSLGGMRELKRQLTHYRRVTLTECLRNFLDDLADAGIEVAYKNVGNTFANYVMFSKEFKSTKYNYKPTIIMYGKDLGGFVSRWYHDEELVTKEVNSLLMLEFGSGQYTQDNTANYLVPRNWRGTFPKGGHGKENVWYWSEDPIIEGEKVNWHYSSGYRPRMPMWKADQAMQLKTEIERIAANAFARTTV